MDDFDVFASKPSSAEENILAESKPTDEKINNQHDDASWIIENNPNTSTPFGDDITSSEAQITSNVEQPIFNVEQPTFNVEQPTFNDEPITFNDEPIIPNGEEIIPLPPTVEDIFSDNSTIEKSENKPAYHLFSNEESSPLYAINKKREQEIAAKDADEKVKIEQLRQQAKTDLERWYNERQRQLEQKRQTMKNEETDLNNKALEKSSKDACDWIKVIRLLEFTDGTQYSKSKRDVTRMKGCILNAKRAYEKKKLANGN